MKKRDDIFRLFRPSMRMYFVFLVIFVLAALFTGKFILAAASLVLMLVFTVSNTFIQFLHNSF